MTIRIAAASLVCGALALGTVQAQVPGTRRAELQRHDLSVPGREALQVRVEIPPGGTAAAHSHPGEELVYGLEGELEYRLEGRPPVILRAGDVLFIPSGTVHEVKNVGTVNGAELATYIVEKGKPLAVPARP
jgi:quercetin dioxygenase-like cupin family protein